ncbi:MAG: 3-dehydro-scyllo-inosose hydrolase [Saccharofermentanales bacterium]|jgi:creatinine amidohydrolase/Fe(II)-dependent formamide hydrolase-like protein
MTENFKGKQWYTTSHPRISFEKGTKVGELKKKLWDSSDDEIDQILKMYGIPAPSELGKAGSYIQTTPRKAQIEKRRKNDIVFIPIGCTEHHGLHANTGLDTFMVTQILEGIRRYTKNQGRECSLTFPSLNYGGHPYHHVGMPGTIIMPEEVVKETLIYTMLGLWDDGYRKMILVNNHGHKWMIESAVQEFFKRFQLPAIVMAVEWHRAVREFFTPENEHEHSFDTPFVHADEAETAVAQLLFPDMIDMSGAVEAWPESYLFEGHYDNSIDAYGRPHTWSEGQGHQAIERKGTPEGVVGNPKLATPEKAKRPIAAILKYLTLVHDEIFEKYPPGKLPPVDKITFRTPEEMEPFLKEPLSEGWKSVHELRPIGVFEKL